jgi:pimeloyl-ACP methyl ester carboxylesterase
MGATASQLRSYRELLGRLSCDVFICLPSPLLLWLPHSAERTAAELLCRIAVVQKQSQRRPIYFILFSGAPKAVYYKALELLLKQEYASLRADVAGEFYDSGPADFCSNDGVRFLAPTGSSAVRRLAVRAAQRVLDAALGSYFEDERRAYWATLEQAEALLRNVPVLLVHSADDELVSAASVLRFHTALLVNGRTNVTRHCLKQSPHVQHLRTDAETYSQLVANWLADGDTAWRASVASSQVTTL